MNPLMIIALLGLAAIALSSKDKAKPVTVPAVTAKPLAVRLQNIDRLSYWQTGIEITLSLSIDNPNPKTVSVNSVYVRVSVNGKEIINAKAEHSDKKTSVLLASRSNLVDDLNFTLPTIQVLPLLPAFTANKNTGAVIGFQATVHAEPYQGTGGSSFNFDQLVTYFKNKK